jgi:hypothetical protein
MARKGTGETFTLWTSDGKVSRLYCIRDDGAGIRRKSQKGGKWAAVPRSSLKEEHRATAERIGLVGLFRSLVDAGHSLATGSIWRPGEPPRDAEWLREALDLRRAERIDQQGYDDESCPEGCSIEPDGTCPHGVKSYLLRVGVI